MKLFITRDVSPSDVCFLIRDELGRDKYTAVMKRRKRSMRGVVNNIVRLNILDENKNLVARLRQLPVAGVNSFTLKTDKTAATLVVLMTNNMVQCRFYGNNWRILGDVISKNFSIFLKFSPKITILYKVSPKQSNYDRERKEETGNVRTAIC